MDSPNASPQAEQILILGLGNPLVGDDGIGPRVIQELRGLELPDTVVTSEGGTAGLGLIGLMEGYQRVIVVDAVDMGQPPGHIATFTPLVARLSTVQAPLSPHQLGVGEAIALAEMLGMGLPELVIVGIQPGQMAMKEGLSQDVEAAVPYVIDAVLRELDRSDNNDL
jgi:hydrogenase maturation protease